MRLPNLLDAIYTYKLQNDVASESEITPCNKNDKPLVVRFSGSVMVMTSTTTLRVFKQH